MTGHDPYSSVTILDEDNESIIPRRGESSAEKIALITVLKNKTITGPHPPITNIATMTTREGSVEEDRTTHSDRSRERKVGRERNSPHIDPVARSHHRTH